MWRRKALCVDVDPEIFFPIAGEGSDAFVRDAAVALAVCAHCPVQRECLAEALDVGAAGIWGGKTEGERRALKRVG